MMKRTLNPDLSFRTKAASPKLTSRKLVNLKSKLNKDSFNLSKFFKKAKRRAFSPTVQNMENVFTPTSGTVNKNSYGGYFFSKEDLKAISRTSEKSKTSDLNELVHRKKGANIQT
mmetsp:Transcript_15003/g.16715  ORF Transcript_15003/g.16715 Transcript_15003/m.16715 type:complete len:115 (-) Transcript_15003:618-962(-)